MKDKPLTKACSSKLKKTMNIDDKIIGATFKAEYHQLHQALYHWTGVLNRINAVVHSETIRNKNKLIMIREIFDEVTA